MNKNFPLSAANNTIDDIKRIADGEEPEFPPKKLSGD